MSEHISRVRFIIFVVVASLAAVCIIGTYGILSVQDVPERIASSQEKVRGTIVDRNGKPLAVSTNFYHLSVTPWAVNNLEKAAQLLAPTLQMNAAQIVQTIQGFPVCFI